MIMSSYANFASSLLMSTAYLTGFKVPFKDSWKSDVKSSQRGISFIAVLVSVVVHHEMLHYRYRRISCLKMGSKPNSEVSRRR